MKRLAYYLKSVWFYFFGNKIDKINLKLEKAAIDSTIARIQLKKTISNDLKKAFGISFSARSMFIPSKGHNPTKLYKYIINKYEDAMIQHNLKLTTSLHWK